jgi:kinesin family protein 2/24
MNFNHQQYLACLHAGQKVDIQRSNGRIHQAIITQVNHAVKTVTVEWQEKSEGKGKEVDLDAIIQFNPQLFTSINGANDNHFNGTHTNRRTRLEYNDLTPYNNDLSPHRAANDANKSKVVKEIERIAANREQRRVKREERRQKLSEVDQSIPASEFQAMVNEYRREYDIKHLTINDPQKDLRICVCVRKRPISKKELNKKDIDVITIPNKDVVVVHLPKVKVDLTKYIDNQKFRFDYSFHESYNNDIVYHFTAKPLVQSLFQGNNPMVFAYGQTGSGTCLILINQNFYLVIF